MSITSRLLTVGLVAALVGVAVAEGDSTQTIKTRDLSYKAPSTWKTERPKSAMRAGQMRIEPAAGDTDPAELTVNFFSGTAGGVEANVTRWEGMFLDADKKTPKAKVEKKKGINVDVTRVEVSGHYIAAMTPGQTARHDKPGYRLLGAIVLTPDSSYFFKLTGPEKTVAAATKGFDALIESMTLDK